MSNAAAVSQTRRSGASTDSEASLDKQSSRAQPVRGRTIRVLCVDDHAILVEGLAARLAIEGGIEVVGRLASAELLVEEVDRLKPDVVILDIEMPGPDAFEMADRLKHRQRNARVMVLSAHIRDTFVSAAFRAGAAAYYSKADELSDIVRGIIEVARSRPHSFLLGPKVRARCQPVLPGRAGAGVGVAGDGVASTESRDTVGETPVTRLSLLTSREAEILRFIGKGLSRTQIAGELCRSVKTVDAHQARMMKKLGILARTDLVRLAIREGLAQA